MKSFLVLLLAICVSTLGWTQKDYQPKGGRYGSKKSKIRTNNYLKRNHTDIFPLDLEYNLNGWFGSIGTNYTFPWRKGEGGEDQSVQDSVGNSFGNAYSYATEPAGDFGFFVDLGYFHSFQEPLWGLFHFYEVGLAYKMLRGKENFEGTTTTDSAGTKTRTVETNTYTYSDNIASLEARITNHYHISRYGFIQNSLGTNIDYFFSSSRSATSDFPGYEPVFPEQITAQINYRLGVGWKASPTILIIPSVDFPLLTVYPFDDFKSALPYFTTRHYPVTLSIRVMILRRLSEDCNVPNYDGPSNFQ